MNSSRAAGMMCEVSKAIEGNAAAIFLVRSNACFAKSVLVFCAPNARQATMTANPENTRTAAPINVSSVKCCRSSQAIKQSASRKSAGQQ